MLFARLVFTLFEKKAYGYSVIVYKLIEDDRSLKRRIPDSWNGIVNAVNETPIHV